RVLPLLVHVFLIERAIQRPHHQRQQHCERQRGDGDRALQRVQAAGQQQGHRNQRLDRAPHCAPPQRRVVAVGAGHAGQHQGGRVGRGDEEDHQQRDRDDRQHARPRQTVEQREQHLFVTLRQRAGEVGAGEHLRPQCGAAERGEPDEAHQRRHQHHAEHEFADTPAARDAGDEAAHERRP
ncbi:hypothetical protein CATMIT_01900, partial [Catenibacterium mitsuokai DSM 15897]